ncbi:MAG: hypothetical protein KAW47_02540 [Thermoplasmatales archaeon]|nr:hypothetical protein [Thermoplasmatales archaeon]
MCKTDFSLVCYYHSNIIGIKDWMTGATCKKCGAKFEYVSLPGKFNGGDWRLIEGDSEYMNKAFSPEDWKRIKNGETPKNSVCPGCNCGIDKNFFKKKEVECPYCGRMLRVESNKLVEVELSDEVSRAPVYKVILHSKTVSWPPCCSICLGPAERFEDRREQYISQGGRDTFSVKNLTLPNVPYCSSCYSKMEKILTLTPEWGGISIAKESDPDMGVMVIRFRNPQYAQMFRVLNAC